MFFWIVYDGRILKENERSRKRRKVDGIVREEIVVKCKKIWWVRCWRFVWIMKFNVYSWKVYIKLFEWIYSIESKIEGV